MNTVISVSLYICAFICVMTALTVTVVYSRPYKRGGRERSFADLLDYAFIGPHDCIVLKNGALMRIYKIKLKTQRYQSDEALDRIHETLHGVFDRMDERTIINYDILRREDDEKDDLSYFGPFIGQALFLKRSEFFKEHRAFKNEFYLSITSLDCKISIGDFERYLFCNYQTASLKKATSAFKKHCLSFEQALSTFLKISICSISEDRKNGTTHEAVNFLNRCICAGNIRLNLKTGRVFLDEFLSHNDFQSGMCPKIGDYHIGVVAVDGFPAASHLNILRVLSELPFEYRFSTRFITYSDVEASVRIEYYRRLWQQKRRGFVSQLLNAPGTSEDRDAVEMIDDVLNAKKDLNQKRLSFGSYSGNIIIFDKDLKTLNVKALQCVKVLEGCGFSGRIESINATDAFMGSLPGHLIENHRRHILSTSVMADLIVTDAPYHGEKYSPNRKYGVKAPSLMRVTGADSKKAYLNLHVQDLANTLVVGPPGAGKSVLLGSLITSLLRYRGMRIFAFDKGCSFYALTLALGGNHLTLDMKSRIRFCPLYDLSAESRINEAAEYVSKLFEYAKRPLGSGEMEVIRNSIRLLSKQPVTEHSLSDLHTLLINSELKEVLGQYCSIADEDSILDGNANPDMNNALTVFECGQFFENSNKSLYPALNCIFSLINNRIVTSECSAIIIDEAWLMMSNKTFCRQLLAWIKTVRKHNTAVILATQSISDFSRNELFEDLLDCVKTRIYLPNADVKTPVLYDIYQKMGLNSRQIDEIYRGTGKRDFFMHKGGMFMPFSLALSETELALLSCTQKDKPYLDDLYKQKHSDFVWDLK